MHETGLLDLPTGSDRPRTSRSCVLQPGWWYSWPMASTLASLCLSQKRRTFWTYVVTVNLFSLYLMNFMSHTMLDAASIVLRMHYKSMKCDVLFSQGSVRTLFRRGGHFLIHEQKKNFFLFTTVQKLLKSIKISQSYDHKCTATFFMVHSVVGFRCISDFCF